MRVLVTYVSPDGSTRGVAERVAQRLRETGVRVDCAPVHDVRGVGDYDGVVVGSALHGRAWLPEAADFLSVHAGDLVVRPVWLFSVGMPGALAPPLRTLAMREGPLAVAPYVELVRPRGTRLFSGVVSKQQFPAVSRLVLRLMGARFGDFRRWPDIDAWADEIADGLAESVRGPHAS